MVGQEQLSLEILQRVHPTALHEYEGEAQKGLRFMQDFEIGCDVLLVPSFEPGVEFLENAKDGLSC